MLTTVLLLIWMKDLEPAFFRDRVSPASGRFEIADVARVDEEALVFILQDQLPEGRRVVQGGKDLSGLFAFRVSSEDDLQFLTKNVF